MSNYWLIFTAFISLLSLLSVSLSLYILIFFKKLSKGIGRNNLIKILSKISEIEKDNSESIKKTDRVIDEIKKDAEKHLQKVSFMRYNPFPEVGGDHSFSLVILDARTNGFIITGLHTRERTRVYVKKIEKGKSKQQLSEEEQGVLTKLL